MAIDTNAGGTPNQDSAAQQETAKVSAGSQRVVLAHGATPAAVSGPVRIGARIHIDLPDEEAQREGFVLPTKEARILRGQFPEKYKELRTYGSLQAGEEGTVQTIPFSGFKAALDRLRAITTEPTVTTEGGGGANG